jgi:hypothetical protein
VLTACALLLFPAVALAGPSASGAGAPRLAVLPLDPVRLPGDALLLLQAELEERGAQRSGHALIPQREMLRHLAAVRALGLECDRESIECITQIGALAGAPLVVRGVAERKRAGARGFEVQLQLWLHDAADGRELSHVFAFLPSDPTVRASSLDDVWARLLAPDEQGGALFIASDVDDADVVIDGIALLHKTPLPGAVRGLLPGDHVVEVRKPGHDALLTRPRVLAGEEAQVYALLPESAHHVDFDVIESEPIADLGALPWLVTGGGVLLMGLGGTAVLVGYAADFLRLAAGGDNLGMLDQYTDGSLDVTDARTRVDIENNRAIIGTTSVLSWPSLLSNAGYAIGLIGGVGVAGGVAMFAVAEE